MRCSIFLMAAAMAGSLGAAGAQGNPPHRGEGLRHGPPPGPVRGQDLAHYGPPQTARRGEFGVSPQWARRGHYQWWHAPQFHRRPGHFWRFGPPQVARRGEDLWRYGPPQTARRGMNLPGSQWAAPEPAPNRAVEDLGERAQAAQDRARWLLDRP